MPHNSEDTNITNGVFADCVKGTVEVLGSIIKDAYMIAKAVDGECTHIGKRPKKDRNVVRKREFKEEHYERTTPTVTITECHDTHTTTTNDDNVSAKDAKNEMDEFFDSWNEISDSITSSSISDGILTIKGKSAVRPDEVEHATDLFIVGFQNAGFEVKKPKVSKNKVRIIAEKYPIVLDHKFILIRDD